MKKTKLQNIKNIIKNELFIIIWASVFITGIPALVRKSDFIIVTEERETVIKILYISLLLIMTFVMIVFSQKNLKNRLGSHYEYRKYLVNELERDEIYKSDETIEDKKEKDDTSDSVSNN